MPARCGVLVCGACELSIVQTRNKCKLLSVQLRCSNAGIFNRSSANGVRQRDRSGSAYGSAWTARGSRSRSRALSNGADRHRFVLPAVRRDGRINACIGDRVHRNDDLRNDRCYRIQIQSLDHCRCAGRAWCFLICCTVSECRFQASPPGGRILPRLRRAARRVSRTNPAPGWTAGFIASRSPIVSAAQRATATDRTGSPARRCCLSSSRILPSACSCPSSSW